MVINYTNFVVGSKYHKNLFTKIRIGSSDYFSFVAALKQLTKQSHSFSWFNFTDDERKRILLAVIYSIIVK